MKLAAIGLLGILVLWAIACTSGDSAPTATPEPTPNVEATVRTGIAATREAEASLEATITARVEATKAAEPTTTPTPTPMLEPTPTPYISEEAKVARNFFDCLEGNLAVARAFTGNYEGPLSEQMHIILGATGDITSQLHDWGAFQATMLAAMTINPLVEPAVRAINLGCIFFGSDEPSEAPQPEDTRTPTPTVTPTPTPEPEEDSNLSKCEEIALEIIERSQNDDSPTGPISEISGIEEISDNLLGVECQGIARLDTSDTQRIKFHKNRLGRYGYEPIEPEEPALTPTVIPIAPNQQSFGNWYQDSDREHYSGLFIGKMGLSDIYEVRIATLDASPEYPDQDLSLSLGCLGPAQVMYISPYSGRRIDYVDTFQVGIWNGVTRLFEEEHDHFDLNPLLSDDETSVYIPNRAQIRQILATFSYAANGLSSQESLTAGIWNSEDETTALWAGFDPTGIGEALEYLGCYHDSPVADRPWVPAQSHESSTWQYSGNWYRDEDWEITAAVFLKDLGLDNDYEFRFATLDATPASPRKEFSFSLGCIGPTQVGYLVPYSLWVPEYVDSYSFGIWNDDAGEYLNPPGISSFSATIADDSVGVYISDNAQLRDIIAILGFGVENLKPNDSLIARIWGADDDHIGLWSRFDPAGMDDALKYLDCFNGFDVGT